MKSVLISIQPKWCELIANGKKTIEVRKTRPKIDTPFKCYIYCTVGGDALCPPHANCNKWDLHKQNNGTIVGRTMTSKEMAESDYKFANGKVIGEFVCDDIITVDCDSVYPFDKSKKEYINNETCLSRDDFWNYTHGMCAYGWHISDLKIYDKPKELSEFKQYNRECRYSNLGLAIPNCKYCKECQVTRPPQSWCYVESEVEQLKEELQEYKDKLADGRMVYQIGCVFAKKHKDLVLQIIETKFDFSLLCQIGKTVFLTLPEAEQALKEMEGK